MNAAHGEVGERSWQGIGGPVAAGGDFVARWKGNGCVVDDAAEEHEVQCLAPGPVMLVVNTGETICGDGQARLLKDFALRCLCGCLVAFGCTTGDLPVQVPVAVLYEKHPPVSIQDHGRGSDPL